MGINGFEVPAAKHGGGKNDPKNKKKAAAPEQKPAEQNAGAKRAESAMGGFAAGVTPQQAGAGRSKAQAVAPAPAIPTGRVDPAAAFGASRKHESDKSALRQYEDQNTKIKFDQSFHPFIFEGQAAAQEQYLQDCIYNTVRVRLPEELVVPARDGRNGAEQTVKIPPEFQEFYVHVTLKHTGGNRIQLPEDSVSVFQNMVDNDRTVIAPELSAVTNLNETFSMVVVAAEFAVTDVPPLIGMQVAVGCVRFAIGFKVHKANNTAVGISLLPAPERGKEPEKKGNTVLEALGSVWTAIVNILTEHDDGNHVAPTTVLTRSRDKFKRTKPFDSEPLKMQYPVTVNSSDDNGNEITAQYNAEVRCFARLNQPTTCPICGHQLSQNGVLGLVLNTESAGQITKTGKAILTFLSEQKGIGQSPLFELARFGTNRVLKQSNHDDRVVDAKDLRAFEQFVRVPFGTLNEPSDAERENAEKEAAAKAKNEKEGRKGVCEDDLRTITPFTQEQADVFKQMLFTLNDYLKEKGTELRTEGIEGKLFLLQQGKKYNYNAQREGSSGCSVHESMICRLCENCMSPLPPEFYRYFDIIQIKYFGNSGAGKTVLIASEYNGDSGGSTKQFHSIIFRAPENYWNRNGKNQETASDRIDTVTYAKKAEMLKQGSFPSGTEELHILPLLLMSIPEDMRELVKTDYLFSYEDMPGSLAAENFDYQDNYAYVFSLPDDLMSFWKKPRNKVMNAQNQGEEEYETLFQKIGNSITHDTTDFTNMQLFLTKIDEYPKYLYDRIHALNVEWMQRKAAFVEGELRTGDLNTNPQQLVVPRECSMVHDVAAYSGALLEILDEEMRKELAEQKASDVVCDGIRNVLNALFSRDEKTLDYDCPFWKFTVNVTDPLLAKKAELIAKRDEELKPTLETIGRLEAENKRETAEYRTAKTDESTVNAKYAPELGLMSALISYLAGICSMPSNYERFREMLLYVMQTANNNTSRSSRYLFTMYGVSATGYSMAEDKAYEANLLKNKPEYNPDFVNEAHRLMQATTIEYCWEREKGEPADKRLLGQTGMSRFFKRKAEKDRNAKDPTMFDVLQGPFVRPDGSMSFLFDRVNTKEDLEAWVDRNLNDLRTDDATRYWNAVAKLYRSMLDAEANARKI